MTEKKPRRPPFRSWLRRHRDDPGPVGDIARDVLADPGWPRGRGSLARYERHLESCHAVPEAVDALREAWALYQATAR